MNDPKQLLVLTGPSASGKSRIALDLAAAHGFEILSADSMSVYRRMDIGTAKPSPSERARVPHSGIDLVEPSETFDTARFVAHADAAIAAAADRGRRVLVAGGTPLYLLALLRGFFDGPPASAELRDRLRAEERRSPGVLHDRLGSVDPEAARRIHRNDAKRLVRALEVFELSGRPISTLQRQFDQGPPRYPYRAVRLVVDRATLHARIAARTRAMFEAGLVGEVRSIMESCGFSSTAAAAIGYHEVLEFLAGRLESDALQGRVRTGTHRLVRRQETWLRRLPEFVPAHVGAADPARAVQIVAAELGLTGSSDA